MLKTVKSIKSGHWQKTISSVEPGILPGITVKMSPHITCFYWFLSLLNCFCEAAWGSEWFRSKVGLTVQLQSPPITKYSSLLHLWITPSKVFKKIYLSVPAVGAYTLKKNIFTLSNSALIFKIWPAIISSTSTETGLKSLERRTPTHPLLQLLWLK